jgi:hypothetical protein
MTRRAPRRMPAAQKALFGGQQPIPQQRKSTRPQINDPELVASVVRAAMNRGYVLVGPAQRVYLRDPGATGKGARVEPVPAYEQDTVHQLLEAGQLTTGGTHVVRAAGREGPASSVLVPKATRSMVTRWANLVPLHGRTRANGGAGDGQSITALLWCPECGERAVAHPPTRWADANGPRPQHSHRDGEPLCPVMTAQGYRPAKPTTHRPTGTGSS